MFAAPPCAWQHTCVPLSYLQPPPLSLPPPGLPFPPLAVLRLWGVSRCSVADVACAVAPSPPQEATIRWMTFGSVSIITARATPPSRKKPRRHAALACSASACVFTRIEHKTVGWGVCRVGGVLLLMLLCRRGRLTQVLYTMLVRCHDLCGRRHSEVWQTSGQSENQATPYANVLVRKRAVCGRTGQTSMFLELPAATTSTTRTPGVGAYFDILTSGAALLTNRRLVGVVVESLEEAGADLVTALAHLNSNHRHLRHCPRVQQ